MENTGPLENDQPHGTPLVTLVLEDGDTVRQPTPLQVSSRGTQLYSDRKWPACSLVELDLDLPDDGTAPACKISCCGLVAHCQPEEDGSMYRVWIRFLDLPDSAGDRITWLTKTSESLCPYCENY